MKIIKQELQFREARTEYNKKRTRDSKRIDGYFKKGK